MSRTSIDGVDWYDTGHAVLGPELVELRRHLDARVESAAIAEGAVPIGVPPIIPVSELRRVEYFASFPHLATFAVGLDPAEQNLAQFVERNREPSVAHVELAATGAVRDVLTPAVCYHLYRRLEGRMLEAPVFLTAVGTCFRNEREALPLQRQRSFTMRENVCVGSSVEVEAFLEKQRAWIDAFIEELGLRATWKHATDPFFRPRQSA